MTGYYVANPTFTSQSYQKIVQFPLTIPGPNGSSMLVVTGVGKDRAAAEADFEAKRLDMIRALGGQPRLSP